MVVYNFCHYDILHVIMKGTKDESNLKIVIKATLLLKHRDKENVGKFNSHFVLCLKYIWRKKQCLYDYTSIIQKQC